MTPVTDSMPGLLSGVRVVSLAQQYPGPYCTMLLADLGADVILVERPGGGDPARALPSFFGALNRGKRSVALDLKQEAGVAICWELLESADVLVEGFRPGVMDRLGLGHDTVLDRLPALVYCSISGYGQDGPYRDRPGHDLSYQALAGLLAGALAGDATAYRPPLAIGDLSSAMFAAFGIVSALLHRERGGTGQHVDVSMTDGLVSWMGVALEPILNGSGVRLPGGDPGYGVFRCADGHYLSLSIAYEDDFWANLCREIGLPEIADVPVLERHRRRDELRGRIAARLETGPRDDWVVRLSDANVPAGPVLALEEVTRDPQLAARGLFADSQDAAGRRGRHVAHPLKLSKTPARPPSPAPGLGEHTEAILRELGHQEAEIERLERGGAIATGSPVEAPE